MRNSSSLFSFLYKHKAWTYATNQKITTVSWGKKTRKKTKKKTKKLCLNATLKLRHMLGPWQTTAVHFILIKVAAHPHPFTPGPQSNSRRWHATSVAARQLAVLPCLLFMVRCGGGGECGQRGVEKKNNAVFIKMGCRRWCAIDLLVIRFQLFVCFWYCKLALSTSVKLTRGAAWFTL